MRTLVNVARYHLADRMTYVVLPWSVMTSSLLINLAIAGLVPRNPHGYYTGGLLTIYAFLLAAGALSTVTVYRSRAGTGCIHLAWTHRDRILAP